MNDIPGPTGTLEAEFSAAPDPDGRCAVLCHPHPQFGGDMHDAVVGALQAALLRAGISCLRFNFRGVGRSDGAFSGGSGEVEDLRAAVAWLVDHSQPSALWLGGYSFGASIAWQASAGLQPPRLLLVAPPVRMMQFPDLTLNGEIDVFAGDRDEYVDLLLLQDLTGVNIHVIAGADHFFTGALGELAEQIDKTVAG